MAIVDAEITTRLNFLSYCGKRVLDLPSWVPDWTACEPLTRKWRAGRSAGLHLTRYHADRVNKEPGGFSFKGRKLVTCGARVGMVDRTYKPADGDLHRKEIRALWNFVTCERPPTLVYSPGEDVETAFWLTMCGGLDVFSHDHEVAYYHRLKPEGYASAREMWKRSVYHGGDYNDEKGYDTELNERFIHIDSVFSDVTFGRCMITTIEGSIGFAPVGSEPGDVVVAVLGGSVPFVLRPTGAGRGRRREYTFIGDAYVHGVMDGEAFDWIKDDRRVVEIFDLV